MVDRIEICSNSIKTVSEITQSIRSILKHCGDMYSEDFEIGLNMLYGDLEQREDELRRELAETFEVGEKIRFKTNEFFAKEWANKEFEVEIQIIDEDGYFGVYTEWGQDKIPAEEAVRI